MQANSFRNVGKKIGKSPRGKENGLDLKPGKKSKGKLNG